MLVLNFCLFCFEIYQIILQGCGMYLLELDNYGDIISSSLMITYSIMSLSKHEEKVCLLILVVATYMHISRGILTLKIFRSTRLLIYKILIIIQDMVPICLLMLARVFMFALLNLIVDRMDDNLDDSSLSGAFGETYLTIFGTIPDQYQMSYMRWIILFVQTIAINLVFLTFLISIVRDSFDRMKRIEKATDYKYMASMMLEVELN